MELAKEAIEKYVKSGKILQEALKLAEKTAKPDTPLLKIAEEIESFIIKKNAFPAFPVNISINNAAAHDTPSLNDVRVLQKNDIAKIDIGVHIEGCITDSAVTVNPSGEFSKLMQASKDALEEAMIKVNEFASLHDIGETIENKIKEFGFKPIENLSGHGILSFVCHASPTIPNIPINDPNTLGEGVYAVEPFATTASSNRVHEESRNEIYSFNEKKPVRNPLARQILELAEKEFSEIPFAERWIYKHTASSEFVVKSALRELLKVKALNSYPVLSVSNGSFVSQAETSFLIDTDDKVRRLV